MAMQSGFIKRIRDIMRMDAGINGDAQRIEQMVWMLFLKYLLAVLQNEAIKNIIFLKETGTANQGNLGSEDMKEFVYVPLPPLEEQHRIVTKLKELLPYCNQLIK